MYQLNPVFKGPGYVLCCVLSAVCCQKLTVCRDVVWL
jgi:hypothetical protein